MKRLFAILFFVAAFFIGVSQSSSWEDVMLKTEWPTPQVIELTNFNDSMLVVNGDFIHLKDSILANGLAYFNNSQWYGWPILGQNYHPQSSVCTPPNDVTSFDNSLIFTSTDFVEDTSVVDPPYGPFYQIRMWNGQSFDTLGRTNSSIVYIKVIGDDLFAFGWFGKINGDSCRGLAKYNGNSWDCLDPPFGYDLPQVNDIYLFDNKLWVGGNFQSNEDAPFSELAYLDLTDSIWNHLDSGMHRDTWSRISRFQEYNGELYIGGVFRYDYGNAGHMIMRWNPEAEEFSDVGGGVFGQNYAYSSLAQVQDMIVYQDELWVSGLFDWAGGINHPSIAVWDGENWCTFGDSIETRVWDMEIFQDELYILTDFINGDTINKVAKWIGGNYRDTCGTFPLWPQGIEEKESENIHVYPNPFTDKLYIASSFVNQTVNYRLFDLSGRVIAKGQYNQAKGIDLSHLVAGIYLLRIEGQQIRTFKVLKQ